MIYHTKDLPEDHFLQPLISKGKRGSYVVRTEFDRELGWTIHHTDGSVIVRESLARSDSVIYVLLNNMDKLLGQTVYFYTGTMGASLASDLGYPYGREMHSPYLPIVEVPYQDAETFIELLSKYKPPNDHVAKEQLGIVLAKTMLG